LVNHTLTLWGQVRRGWVRGEIGGVSKKGTSLTAPGRKSFLARQAGPAPKFLLHSCDDRVGEKRGGRKDPSLRRGEMKSPKKVSVNKKKGEGKAQTPGVW